MKIKAGIIGFGKMGMLHGALINAHPGCELVAVADKSAFMVKAYRSVMPDIKFYTSEDELLSHAKINALIIATPTFAHVPIAMKAATKNIHLFIEKPLSTNLSDAQKLFDATKNNSTTNLVGFCLRYTPTFIEARKLLQQDIVGKISSVTAEMHICDVLSPQKGWRYQKKIAGGGVLLDFTVHMLDLLYWYFGQVESVKGQTFQIHSADVEDEVKVDLKFSQGITAKLLSSWSKPEHRKSFAKIIVTGSKGTLEITDQTIHLFKNGKISQEIYYPELYKGYYIDIGGPNYSLQMADFINSIQKGKQPCTNIKTALYVQNLVDKIYQSANDNHKLIKIDSKS